MAAAAQQSAELKAMKAPSVCEYKDSIMSVTPHDKKADEINL